MNRYPRPLDVVVDIEKGAERGDVDIKVVIVDPNLRTNLQSTTGNRLKGWSSRVFIEMLPLALDHVAHLSQRLLPTTDGINRHQQPIGVATGEQLLHQPDFALQVR